MVVLDHEMLRHPSGASPDAAAFLQRVEEKRATETDYIAPHPGSRMRPTRPARYRSWRP